MKSKAATEANGKQEKFVEGVDYYFENGLMILTARFLLNRGYRCENGCRSCPYEPKENEKSQQVDF